jgi:hypothetical protein
MGVLVSIPHRDLRVLDGGKKLTPLSTDIFFSIPHRDYTTYLEQISLHQTTDMVSQKELVTKSQTYSTG